MNNAQLRWLWILASSLGILFAGGAANAQGDGLLVLNGASLEEGFDLGVDTDKGERAWLTRGPGGFLQLDYPAGQAWGAVFITVGPPMSEDRPSMDLSDYKRLAIEFKGAKGGELVLVGLKTNTDPDDGSETKLAIQLEAEWDTHVFDIASFRGADPANLYVVSEFVFSGAEPASIAVRRVEFLK